MEQNNLNTIWYKDINGHTEHKNFYGQKHKNTRKKKAAEYEQPTAYNRNHI